jgi:hypothetical protein
MEGHGERMVGEHCRIQSNLKSFLMKNGVCNMRVLDTLGTLTSKSTVSEQMDALRPLAARDNVHLTATGYKALAEGIYKEAQNFGISKSKGKHSLSGMQMVKAAEWHGFVSNQGVGKTSLKQRWASTLANGSKLDSDLIYDLRSRGGIDRTFWKIRE